MKRKLLEEIVRKFIECNAKKMKMKKVKKG